MVAVKQLGFRRSVGSRLSVKFWCIGKAGASSLRPRMNGRTSSVLAWAPGQERFPARSSKRFGICVTRLPNAAIHARHRHGELCPPRPGRVAARLLEHRPSQLCMSSIALAELRFGAEARRSQKLHDLISTFAEAIAVVPFDQSAADRFAAVSLNSHQERCRLRRFRPRSITRSQSRCSWRWPE
jgi:hypothetical protein